MPIDQIDDNELLSQLGVAEPLENDVTQLKHVKPRAEVRAAEEIADRTPCEDFDSFRTIFEAVQKDLDDGTRETRPFGKKETGIEHDASITKGDLFILSGQVVYVAHVGEPIKAPNGEQDARLRVIYSNGTESDILRRSLQRALYKDEAGRRITNFGGPLFSNVSDDEDLASGTIYVLKSKSSDPIVSQNRTILHKIGVTSGNVGRRIANAAQDPTFLMADVEVVATYELYNINRTKLEKLLHRFFAAARLDLEISDRFGHPIKPQEWFFVPVPAIDDAVDKIRNGTIGDYQFDPSTAQLEQR
ncbi:MAG: GIY-YIG nuclease family protein [Parvibaculaceae bacterium]